MPLIQVNLQDMKVLVVDDSSTARRFMKEILHEMGVVHVVAAAEGAEALKMLQEFPADIMLCDLHMAPLDGIELTRILRNADDSPNPYLPVIMLTADATQVQLKNALTAGVNAFMSKPVKMDTLHKKLVAVFSRPFVFVREGRTLLPLLASSANCGAALQEPAELDVADREKKQLPASADADPEILTRSDMGLR
jgi:CheY-like chemotaxis protein